MDIDRVQSGGAESTHTPREFPQQHSPTPTQSPSGAALPPKLADFTPFRVCLPKASIALEVIRADWPLEASGKRAPRLIRGCDSFPIIQIDHERSVTQLSVRGHPLSWETRASEQGLDPQREVEEVLAFASNYQHARLLPKDRKILDCNHNLYFIRGLALHKVGLDQEALDDTHYAERITIALLRNASEPGKRGLLADQLLNVLEYQVLIALSMLNNDLNFRKCCDIIHRCRDTALEWAATCLPDKVSELQNYFGLTLGAASKTYAQLKTSGIFPKAKNPELRMSGVGTDLRRLLDSFGKTDEVRIVGVTGEQLMIQRRVPGGIEELFYSEKHPLSKPHRSRDTVLALLTASRLKPKDVERTKPISSPTSRLLLAEAALYHKRAEMLNATEHWERAERDAKIALRCALYVQNYSSEQNLRWLATQDLPKYFCTHTVALVELRAQKAGPEAGLRQLLSAEYALKSFKLSHQQEEIRAATCDMQDCFDALAERLLQRAQSSATAQVVYLKRALRSARDSEEYELAAKLQRKIDSLSAQ